MDRNKARFLRQELDKILKDFADTHSLTFVPSNVSFDSMTFRTRVEFRDVPQQDFAREDWASLCHMVGLTREDFGRSFKYQGKTYTLHAIKPSSHKYPIVVVSNGKMYKFNMGVVKEALNANR